MNFSGAGTRLSGNDYARAAQVIGCEEVGIRAVCQVEARGSGFDAKNRPIVLYEPHVMYRNVSGEARRKAMDAGLAYAVWQPGHYPETQDGRYSQIERACAIDADAGLEAASWGIGQVLSENFKVCGYKSPQDLVSRCVASEGGQLDVIVAFIRGRGLGKYLVKRDWAGFALGYNGSAYAKNQYDVKLKRAYDRLKIGASAAYDPLADGLLSLGDKGDVVKVLQSHLGTFADGDFGPMTDQAVKVFQKEHGLVVDGKVGRQTGKLLGLSYWN